VPPVLGIITGLRFEAELLQAAAHRHGEAPLIAVAGLGAGRAAQAARMLLRQGATHLLSFGLAAGLVPDLKPGMAIVATGVQAARGVQLCDADWTARLATATQARRGTVAHADEIAATVAAKAALAAGGAIAADMESAGVIEVATVMGRPVAVLRVISDTADQTLPSAAMLAMDSAGNLRPGLVAAAIFGAPWELPSLIRLGWSTAKARKRLTELAGLGLGRSFFAHFGDK
jgi:nucleoside phosphorylase